MIIVQYFNNFLLIVDQPKSQQISENTEDANNTVNLLDLIYRALRTHIVLKCTRSILQD